MITAMNAERERREGQRERWIFLLYCPPMINRSSGVFTVRKACSIAVSTLVSKILGDKKRVCMWLCVKANDGAHTHTHTHCLSIECLHTVVKLCFSPYTHRLHRDLFLFFSHSPGHDSRPRRSVCVPLES